MNRGKNFDVEPTDFTLAQKIYGDATAVLRGKTVKKKTNRADMTICEKTQLVPQILALDIMYVDRVGILIGLAYPLDLTLATPLLSSDGRISRAAPAIRRGIDILIGSLTA